MAKYDFNIINEAVAQIAQNYAEGRDYCKDELKFEGHLLQFIDDSIGDVLTTDICLWLARHGVEYDCELCDDGYTEILVLE